MSHAARGPFWFVCRYLLTLISLPLFTDAFPSSSTSAWGRCADVLLQICCLFVYVFKFRGKCSLLVTVFSAVNAQAVQSMSSSNAKAKYVFMTFLCTCVFILENSWNLCFMFIFHHFIKHILYLLHSGHILILGGQSLPGWIFCFKQPYGLHLKK